MIMNHEFGRILKEDVISCLRYHLIICMDGLSSGQNS